MIGIVGECRESIPDGRDAVMNGARTKDAAAHAMFDHSEWVAR
jgi:hypothetical protein